MIDELLLGFLDIKHTEFFTARIPTTALAAGVPIGIGACKAVRLQLNVLVRNSLVGAPIPAAEQLLYYGDRNSQEFELYVSAQRMSARSELIICQDLSEIYVRGNGTANFVQVMKYV